LRWHPQAETTDRSSLTNDVCRGCRDMSMAIQMWLAATLPPL